MANEQNRLPLREISRLFQGGTLTGLDEGQLLERFVAGYDESSLEALVERHGPMVLGVCRRWLADPHDVEDAFQATFLVLIRKARALRDLHRLGPWLHDVAYRVSARARADAARRRAMEQAGSRPECNAADLAPSHMVLRAEICGMVDEELARLSAAYRAAIVLCDLEGQSQRDAARLLGWSEGVLRGRLARARRKLRDRLTRRGVAPTLLSAEAPLLTNGVTEVPPALIEATRRGATACALAGRAAPAGTIAISASVAALTQGAIRVMTLSRVKILGFVATVAAVGLLTVGGLVRAGLFADEKPRGSGLPLASSPQSDSQSKSPLEQPLRIRGEVVDARSGQPIKRFHIIPGEINGRTRFYWSRGPAIPGSEGRFDLPPRKPRPSDVPCYVRVEADGYIPANSRPIETREGEVTLTFKLREGKGLAGVVKRRDGSPAANADVCLFNENITLLLHNGRLDPRRGESWSTRTDEHGRFAFQPQDESFNIMVQHDEGYAQRSHEALARSADVTLEPWSRIEGTIRIGNQLGVHQPIRIQLDRTGLGSSSYDYQFYTYTIQIDNQGRFVVDRLMAGEAQVYRIDDYGGGREFSVPTGFPFEVKAGQTITVRAGGHGRPITGRVITQAPDPTALPPSRFVTRPMRGTLERKQIDIPRPPEFAAWDVERKKSYVQREYLSPEGKAARRERWFADFSVGPEGRFRLDDVVPGRYRLTVEFTDLPPGMVSTKPTAPGQNDLRGVLTREIEIGPIPGGRSDEPLDLGTLPMKLEVYRHLTIGQPAPALEFQTLDGKPRRLADFRGKFVLLDFWATWCGPCLEEEPHVKAAFDAFAKDDRFVLISLSLDEAVEAPKGYAAKHDLKGTQGFLGQGSRASADYGLTSIPQIILIGPDGKVVAMDLSGPGIKSMVAQALKR
jgi:RNA polymerase sigma factor (sigma-70 family)